MSSFKKLVALLVLRLRLVGKLKMKKGFVHHGRHETHFGALFKPLEGLVKVLLAVAIALFEADGKVV